MSACYVSTKYIKQITKKPKLKVISSKVQLHEHRTKKLRFQVGHLKKDRSPTTVAVTLRTDPKRPEDVKARNIHQEMKGIDRKPTLQVSPPRGRGDVSHLPVRPLRGNRCSEEIIPAPMASPKRSTLKTPVVSPEKR